MFLSRGSSELHNGKHGFENDTCPHFVFWLLAYLHTSIIYAKQRYPTSTTPFSRVLQRPSHWEVSINIIPNSNEKKHAEYDFTWILQFC